MSETNTKQLIELKNLIEGAEISLQQARQVLDTLVTGKESSSLISQAKTVGSTSSTEEGQVIEGIFDGQNMVGPDGKKYSVPANYASKSKMVEGDKLKLTITLDGSFVYKQVQPIDRDHITGKLLVDEETGDYRVLASNKSYKVLSASITYFKGEPGDSVTLLVPKGKETSWAAVDNVFKVSESEGDTPEVEASLPAEEVKQDKDESDKKDEENLGSEFLEPDNSTNSEEVEEKVEEEPSLELEKEEIQTNQQAEPELGQKNFNPTEQIEYSKLDEKPEELSNQEQIQPVSTVPEAQITEKTQPEDIFSATEKVNTNDVNQVDILPTADAVRRADPEITNEDKNNLPQNNQQTNFNQPPKTVDNQGLEEI